MRKWMTGLAGLCMLALWAGASLAAGVTIRTFTPFADVDFAAQGYMDMITAWESETGNVVEDYSGLPDEALMAQLGGLIESGAADVVVLDPERGITVDAEAFASKGHNTPFHGKTYSGAVCMTMVGGRVIYEEA